MKLFSATAALLTILLFPTGASAVHIDFSGSAGNPFTMTISAPVTFKITVADNKALDIIIKSVYDTSVTNGGAWAGIANPTNPMTFSINNTAGSNGYIYQFLQGYDISDDVDAKDVLLLTTLMGSNYEYSQGDVFTLNAGTYLVDRAPDNFVYPVSGEYTMFLADSWYSNRYSEDGVQAVPEPSTWVFLGAGASGIAVLLRRRRLAKTA